MTHGQKIADEISKLIDAMTDIDNTYNSGSYKRRLAILIDEALISYAAVGRTK